MDKCKILVVDDESRMRKLVRDFLVKQDFEVLEAGDGEEALDVFYKVKDIALVILDVMMPKMDGWEVCREIRKDSKVPIIMLTARGDERDELLGFELGVARVEAILRRTNARGTEDILQAGGIEINKSAHIAAIDGEPMELSYKEFELLTYFMENQGIALSREKILNSVWNYDYFGDARTIDTHVKKLRSKMGKKGELRRSGAWAINSRCKAMKIMKKFMEKSIRNRLAVTFIGMMVLFLVMIILINTFFLERVYTISRERCILQTYNTLNDSDSYSSLNTRAFGDYLLENNLSLIIVDKDSSQMLYHFAKDAEDMRDRLLFGLPMDLEGDQQILRSSDNYVLERRMNTPSITDSINMFGTLDNGDEFLISTPIESLKDSARLSNMFYITIGLVMIVFSSAVVLILAGRITKPLHKLSELSQEMANLNFSVKYDSSSQDEVGVLGNNLNKMSEELERTISELKTANNELQKDIEKKIQIDEMRKEFLSNVSHELKTPIALIQGYAEGLQECINDDPESREFYCDVIIDEAGKMNNMVKKLLSLNQLEFGNDQVTMERFNITELIRGVVQSSQLLASQKEADLRFVQKNPVYVWGDEFKIEEVITNYVSNALNHVDYDKKIEVKIIQKGKLIRVSVFNTGEPIPQEDLDKIWIKFYKVDKARTREYGGSGIGLSIVKAIMDSFHQKCGVKNFENGVEFWFELDGSRSENEEQPALEQKNE